MTSYGVDADPYEGIDIVGLAQEAAFKAAVRGMNGWKDNLSLGRGATGTRRPWVNTGEARADITMSPQRPDAFEYRVGGDVVQLWIAEFGRAPNNTMPPHAPIAQWVQEKGIASPGDDDFESIVWAIRKGIAENGIKGFAPGQAAVDASVAGLEGEIAREVQRRLE